MIVLKNLSVQTSENMSRPIEDGGELEHYVSPNIKAFLEQHFGILCDVEIKK